MDLAEQISKLQKGESVQFRGDGPSMQGKIESGQFVTVERVPTSDLQVGDIVLCRVPNGNVYLHFIKEIENRSELGRQFLIASNFGDDGWVQSDQIYGKCVRAEWLLDE
jgi:hypothetical protein